MARSTPAQSRHDALLAKGRAALMAGDKPRAQALLQAAIQLDPSSDEAWVWLSGTHTDAAEMAACLERALAINPANEQARDGLHWLQTQPAADDLPLPTAAPSPAPEPIALQTAHPSHMSLGALAEAALHPFAVGALLGLLRLLTWLRPPTLAVAAPLGLGRALGVGVAAALLHGLVVAALWLALGWWISRVRVQRRGDLFDSLERASSVWLPGYLLGGALAAAAIGVGWSGGAWTIIGALCWLLIGGAALLIGRRIVRLAEDVGTTSTHLIRWGVIVAVIGAAGLWLAGAVMAALL